MRIIVGSRPGGFTDALLTSPPEGTQSSPLVLPPVAADAAAEILVVGGRTLPMAEILAAFPRLRWIHASSTGVERFLVPELIARDDIVLTNSSGGHELPMAEFVIAGLFAAAKQLGSHVRGSAARHWLTSDERARHRQLHGATLLVVGAGRVGAEVARLAGTLGLRLIAVRRSGAPVAGVDEVGRPEDLARLAARADYVAVTAALTPETRGLVSHEVIAALPRHAWLINVGRGAVVDEAALLDAVRTGRIGGAILDALWTEPLPAESPWWNLPNVIVTSHSSSTGAPEMLDRMLALFRENLGRLRAGAPLINVVDKRAGY